MVGKCPNKNHQDWKDIVEKYGEDIAYAAYIKNGENVPPLSYVDSILSNITKKEDTSHSIEKQTKLLESTRNAITQQLEKMGIGVGALTEYESNVGIDGLEVNGVFDPQATTRTANGLVELIRIAQGNKGLQALPEEFAHLVDAALKGTNNPIYDRLTALLKNEEVVKQVFEQEEPGSYDRYFGIYKGNIDQIADEARAKLIAKHIIRNEEIKASPWQRLVQRLKDLFNRTFSKGDANDLQYQIHKADVEFSKFAADLMGGKINISLNLNSLENKHKMFNAKVSLSRSEKLFKKIIEIEHKRAKIEESNKKLTPKQKEELDAKNIKINRLEVLKNQQRFDEGIFNFITQAIDDMNALIQQLDTIKLHKGMVTSDLNQVAKFLRELKGYINAYKPILSELIGYTLSDEYKNQDLFDFSDALKNLTSIINTAEVQYNEAASPLFTQFIKQFTGNLIGTKLKGKVITSEYIDNLMVEASTDIGFMDRWLFAMAESSDLLLRLIERPIKNARFKAKERTDETVRQLQKAQEDLEKAGHKSDFIYEKDSEGKLTGRYIQELDWTKFYDAQTKEQSRLDAKYGSRNDSSQWWKDFYKWRDANMVQDSESKKWSPKVGLYSNRAYKALTPAQKTFYDSIISIKKELDNYLPDNKISPYLLPQVRKDFLERLKDSKGVNDLRKKLGSGIADSWVARESDDEFGSRYGLQDFDGTKLNTLPVYYTSKLSDMSQLSTDIVSTMAMYADMAHNYEAMNSIIDIMEVGKDLLQNRNIDDTLGGKSIKEVIKREGRRIENKVIKRKGSSKFIDRLQDFYDIQIYGKTSKEEGSFTLPFTDVQISIAKAGSQLNKMTALNTYAFNVLSGVANVTMGEIMIRTEAIAKQHFNATELAKADLIYSKNLPSVLGQIGTRRKTNKFDLMMIKFNVMQNHEEAVRTLEMNKKNIFARLINSSALFFINNCGEHWLQSRTFLALAQRMKLKDAQGKELTLWDAYEVVKGEDGIERVEIKKGVTKLDGTEFTSKDVEALSRKSARINQKLHGIYNKEDMNAFQSTTVGKIAMMFRKWMVSSYNRRFQGENYSFDLDEVEQGFYNSTWHFLKELILDLREGKIEMATKWKSLSSLEKSNILRSIAEVGFFFASVLAYSLLADQWDGDDEWYKSFALYQIRRLQTEIGVFVPLGYTQAKEGLKILQSPGAGINYADNLLGILAVWDIFKEPLQSGMYEGMNPYIRNWVRNAPLVNPIMKMTQPEESLKFYTSSR